MDVQCHKCGGVGCPTCKGEGWIELLGAGMIHPRVLEMSGIDPTSIPAGPSASAWSAPPCGASNRRSAADFENDVRFLEQLLMAQPQNRRGGYQPPACFRI